MKSTLILATAASILALSACETYGTSAPEVETAEVVETVEVETVAEAPADKVEAVAATMSNAEVLAGILAAQPDEVKARYDARHPAETLAFFGIEPGMKVMEALPGGGWYTKILMPYLGADGKLMGGQYPDAIWPIIFPDGDEERIAMFMARSAGWKDQAKEWVGDDGPKVGSYQMTTLAEDKANKIDAALFIRALHNLHRSEADDAFMSKTIAETYRLLKPGGVVGVVQHRAPETNSDEWADGNAGYLKQSVVIKAFEDAGFTLVGTSEINANANDVPSEDDFVWRLPPTRAGAETDEQKAAVNAIGESDRMTLKFMKPAE